MVANTYIIAKRIIPFAKRKRDGNLAVNKIFITFAQKEENKQSQI